MDEDAADTPTSEWQGTWDAIKELLHARGTYDEWIDEDPEGRDPHELPRDLAQQTTIPAGPRTRPRARLRRRGPARAPPPGPRRSRELGHNIIVAPRRLPHFMFGLETSRILR